MRGSMEDAAFAALRWTRLRGSVRNLHAAGAREHPLWILHSLLMFCVPEAAKNGQSRFLFRPLAEPGDVIERDRLYPFAAIAFRHRLAVASAKDGHPSTIHHFLHSSHGAQQPQRDVVFERRALEPARTAPVRHGLGAQDPP